MSDHLRLVLASASPRRRELLGQLGVHAEVRPAEVDETPLRGEGSVDYVLRLAEAKARAVASTDAVTLAADTCIDMDGVIIGKPADAGDAARTLRQLSGRSHDVISGVAVHHPDRSPSLASAAVTTAVTFVTLTETQIDWYITTGEPLDKAGAYAIQGAGGLFVETIRGSASNVIGLPLAETAALFRRHGLELLDYAAPPSG